MQRLSRRQALGGLAAASVIGAPVAAAGQERFGRGVWTDTWGRAIGGYDCVSYFAREEGPERGSRAYELHWRGAIWLFASMRSMEAFAGAADRYAPLCGGYCVETLAARGRLVGCDPLVWDMYNGRLAMMSSLEKREAWLADPDARFAAANAAYTDLFS